MNRLIRFYNQNRGLFWTIVFVIIGIIALVQALNNYAKNTKEESSGITNTTTYNSIQNPIISGSDIKKETSSQITKVIDNFIMYCNNGEIEEAYNLLSNACKEELFPDLEAFKNNYYNKIFTDYRIYDVTAWINNNNHFTYKVKITEDILATGDTSNLNIEDYYTIVKDNNEYKLNIHNYIGKENVNIIKTFENVTFDVIQKNIYMDYETYKIGVTNNTGKRIMLDTKEQSRTVNVVDQNGLKYVAFLNEVLESDLTVLSGMSKQVEIKFNKSYNPDYKSEYIEFSDLILDLDNKNNRSTIKIEL